MFRASRVLLSALRQVSNHPAFRPGLLPVKASTGITGLEPIADPLPALKSIYSSTLSTLSSLPSGSVYRQATEALTKHRLEVIEKSNEDVLKVESELGKIIELTIEEAKAEQALVGKMIEWKSWENLEQEPQPDQWKYFEPASDV